MDLIVFRSIVSFFQPFCGILATLIMLGYDIKDIWRKTFVFSLILTILVGFTYLIQNELIRHLTNWTATVIVYKAIFKHSWWISIRNYLIMFFIFQVPPCIVGMLIMEGIMGPYQNVQHTVQFWAISMLVITPLSLAMVLSAFLLRKTAQRWTGLLKGIRSNSQDAVFLIAVIIQTALIFLCLEATANSANFSNILFSAWMIIIGLNVYIMYSAIRFREHTIMTSAEQVISSNVADFINTVRSQRHDFSNHLQVITALCHNNQQDELKAYVAALNAEARFYNQILKVDNPFIAALVNAKIARSDAGKIRLETEINTSLASINRNSLAIVRILGNLLDNAIEVLEQQELEDRWIRLLIHEKGPFIVFAVSNPGTITNEAAASLFQPGFTSKDQAHDGLGLYSAGRLARKLGGSVECSSDHNGTTFTLLIPQ